jgi:hypothetical protein
MKARASLVLAGVCLAGAWAALSVRHSDTAPATPTSYAAPGFAHTTAAPSSGPTITEIPERARLREWLSGTPQRLEVQGCLTSLGYDLGPVGPDGTDGPKTAAAVKAFTSGGPLSDDQIRACYQGILLAKAAAAKGPRGIGL